MLTPHRLGWLNPRHLGRPHIGRRTAPNGLQGLPTTCLLAHLPPVYDQGQVGSCTANALAGAVEILQARGGYPQERPDRTALYYRERSMEGSVAEDAGAIIADGIAVLRAGYEREESYAPAWGPTWTTRPPRRPDDAPRVVSAEPLDVDVPTIAWELACGHPVVVGISVTEAWETLVGGTLPEPEGASIGGHAVLLTGYSLERGAFWMRNSWGEGFGEGGYAWLPFSWLSLPWCDESHALRAVRKAQAA